MYEVIGKDRPIDQGDLLADCPIVGLDSGMGNEWEVPRNNSRVIVLTQTCDFANNKVRQALIARVHSCAEVIAAEQLNEKTIRDLVRAHKMPG